MNADQIIRLLSRMFLRPLMNRGIKSGINRMAGGGKPPAEMTPEERAQAKTGQDMAKRARQLTKLGRRIGRF